MITTAFLKRFLAKIDFSSSGACWIWKGDVDKDGYGRIRSSYERVRAHRIAYETFNGFIPKDMCVLHACDVPACCNPSHLFLGTLADNNKDTAAKGRHWNKKKTHCKHGHEFTANNTIVRGKRRDCRTCHNAEIKARYWRNK